MIDFKKYYNRISKKHLKWAAISLGALVFIFGIALIVFFQKRDALLAEAIAKAKVKMKEEYHVDLQIANASFSGLTSIVLNDLRVIPEQGEQLAGIKHLEISVKVFPLLSKVIKIGEVNLNEGSLTLVKKDSLSNFDFFIKAKAVDEDSLSTKKEPMDLAKLADQMVNSLLYKIPDNMKLRDFEFSYRDDSLYQTLNLPQADIVRGKLTSLIHVNGNEAIWHVEGRLNPGQKNLYLRLFAEGKKVEFPLLEKKYGLKLTFDTLETSLEKVKWKNKEELSMSGIWKVSNLLVNHWRIASNDVIVKNGFLDANLLIGKDFVALDETSEMKIVKLTAYPYAKLTLGPNKTYAFGLRTEDIPAQDVFDSFPTGLFTSLDGIRVSGKMKYNLDFFFDPKEPDSVQLESSLSAQQFAINSWGKVNLAKINTPFNYTPYENGKAQRTIAVGPDNPNFTPLSQVSPYLKNAILTAEDPSFFEHEGFVPQAIRASIATNFKEKAFKRGGSTISMQLVKNVYLDREKTLARKAEEMLIVWLIEHNKIVSKERQFEVYLNIIEWGRNVYGVGEAARFYFAKTPAQLDLGESIFLASIVPRPKSGLYKFDYTGGLKPYMSGYFKLVGGLMAQRGYASADSTRSYGFYSVSLREALRPEAPKVDSTETVEDTNFLENEIEGIKKMLQDLFKGRENAGNE